MYNKFITLYCANINYFALYTSYYVGGRTKIFISVDNCRRMCFSLYCINPGSGWPICQCCIVSFCRLRDEDALCSNNALPYWRLFSLCMDMLNAVVAFFVGNPNFCACFIFWLMVLFWIHKCSHVSDGWGVCGYGWPV